MRSERIYDAMADIKDEFIIEAHEHKIKKSPLAIVRWCALAVALMIVVGLCASVLVMFFSYDTLPLPGGGAGGGGLGQIGEDGSTVFMSYAGPVFPLTVYGDVSGISAGRSITFDFTGNFNDTWTTASVWRHHSDIRVLDSYTLTNSAASDKTVQIIYPFSGSFSELGRLFPAVFADGSELETRLLAGAYSGGFQATDGHEDEAINLRLINSWQDYYALLSDGAYLSRALGGAPVLNQSVIVYEFTNWTADHDASVNPTLAVGFNLDYDRTTVLSYGFHGALIDPDSGFMRQSFSVPQDPHSGAAPADRMFKLIVIGDDITDITMQGYANAGWHPGEERDDISAVMTRSEAVLSDVLTQIIEAFLAQPPYSGGFTIQMFHRAIAEMLSDFGMLSENVLRRYDTGWLSDILSETLVMSRVFYLVADVTIPAGESIEITIDMIKPASFDFHGSGLRSANLFGYDMMTTLGSALSFSSQAASLEGYEHIEIINQNFGFDPGNGITQVELSLDTPRYFIEVRWEQRP